MCTVHVVSEMIELLGDWKEVSNYHSRAVRKIVSGKL